jgi:DNA-binding IclR family transcriptional regulator
VEFAAALELSASSAHQLLKSMMDAAYLLFDPASKRYRPSLRASRLGAPLGSFTFAGDAIGHLVSALHDAFDTTITISACQGGFMQIIDVFEPAPTVIVAPRSRRDLRENSIGLRVPIFGSCTGAAWLSAQDEAAILSAARLCRRALGEHAGEDLQLIDIARRVRQQGYAFGGISPDESTRAVAVPLPRDPTGTVYVMATSASAEHMAENRNAIGQTMLGQISEHLSGAQVGNRTQPVLPGEDEAPIEVDIPTRADDQGRNFPSPTS